MRQITADLHSARMCFHEGGVRKRQCHHRLALGEGRGLDRLIGEAARRTERSSPGFEPRQVTTKYRQIGVGSPRAKLHSKWVEQRASAVEATRVEGEKARDQGRPELGGDAVLGILERKRSGEPFLVDAAAEQEAEDR